MHLPKAFRTTAQLAEVLLLFAPCCFLSAASENLVSEDLAPLSKPSGATRFTTLSPEETGIRMVNEYRDPRMWTDRYQEFALGAIGTGISICDYDNDGRPDIYAVNKTGQSRLYRNLGDWKFEDVTDAAGLGVKEDGWLDSVSSWFASGDDQEEGVEIWKQGAAFADVNNDGWPDLYICRFRAANQLYLNNGDGSFTRAVDDGGLGVVSASGMAAFCDFDRDGWLDVFLQTNMLDSAKNPKGSSDFLFRNNGDGTFTDVTKNLGLDQLTLGHSALCWDYNEDGWPDLYIANDFDTPDSLLKNESSPGSIKFSDMINEVVPRQPFSSMGADLGDINNDGHIDYLVADMAPTSHEMDQRGMAVTRYVMRQEIQDHDQAPQFMFNTLYLNTGIGRMMEIAELAGLARTDWTWSVRFADLDCDGLLDLHITNGMVREYQNDDLRQKIYRAVHPSARMRLVKASPVMEETNLAFHNRGDLSFERVESDWGLGEVGVSFGAAFGDLDGDGDLDLVYANYEAPPTVLRNDSQSGNRITIALRGTASNRFGAGARLELKTASGTQTRTLVLSRGYLSGSEPIVHFGLGHDEAAEQLTIRWPSGRIQILDHLAAGKRYLITEPDQSSAVPASEESTPLFVQVELPAIPNSQKLPSLPAQALAPFRFDEGTGSIARGDFDGDGFADLAFGGAGHVSILHGQENGEYEQAKTIFQEGSDGPLASGDFNGDGLDELFIAGRDGSYLFQNGEISTLETPFHVLSAVTSDFNRDGYLDLFIGAGPQRGEYPLSTYSNLFLGGKETLSAPSDLLIDNGDLGLVYAALWIDYNADGWDDLAIATQWNPIRLFENVNGQRFTEVTESAGFAQAGSGLWMSLATGDFNNDGIPDIAAGNMGLNTPYRASKAEPAFMLYGQFGGRGNGQIIEGLWDNGKRYPARSLKQLGDAIPSLLKRFPSNDAFAASTLESVFGKDTISNAQVFEASELRSGFFLSKQDGSYAFRPFPKLAQAGPARDLASGDFNADGHLDLVMTHGLYSVDPTIGRFDGGLGQLLLGDGDGGFTAPYPETSGFAVIGEGTSILTLDLNEDGALDLISASRANPPVAFINRGKESE